MVGNPQYIAELDEGVVYGPLIYGLIETLKISAISLAAHSLEAYCSAPCVKPLWSIRIPSELFFKSVRTRLFSFSFTSRILYSAPF